MPDARHFENGDHHIAASRSLVDRTLRTLKHDDLFGVFGKDGDCLGRRGDPDGLYYKDTRYLSRLKTKVGGCSPLLLSSLVLDDNGALIVDQTNADLRDESGDIWLPRDSLFVGRTRFLHDATCYDRIVVRRFERSSGKVSLELAFAADFADLFEVRGERRARRGDIRSEADGRWARFVYEGLDRIERRTTLYFDPPPDLLTTGTARWDIDLEQQNSFTVTMKAACSRGAEAGDEPPPLPAAYRRVRESGQLWTRRLDIITSSSETFDAIVSRSASDIHMLLTQTSHGPYPYAGVPWFSTKFGRDGIITAMMMLWAAPEVAQGVLRFLAANQATGMDPATDAEPGKILHEMRDGEMAMLGEVPFGLYYGSIDATPLFVMLAGMYLERSGDLATIRDLWPSIEAALRWIDDSGDRDGDGFVEYFRQTDNGLANQGWKDSEDSIFHADGSLARGPIALCEVQAYVFAARRQAARMARALGDAARADELERKAETLRQQFEAQFWDEGLGTYVLALDGAKAPCRVLASNAGHALFAGIASPDRAHRVAALLMEQRFFNGWGIRTVAKGEARYNPMSYHNGSVWPHDNGLIALGLGRYGHKVAVARIIDGLVGAACYQELYRLPELFCGFPRRPRRGPSAYPVACSPQAWAAATPYALVEAAAGLAIDAAAGRVSLEEPLLPPMLSRLRLARLKAGASRFDVDIARVGDATSSQVTRRGAQA